MIWKLTILITISITLLPLAAPIKDKLSEYKNRVNDYRRKKRPPCFKQDHNTPINTSIIPP